MFTHLPLLLVALYVAYETLMPVEMNIRIDLGILLPAFALVFLSYLAKLILLLTKRHVSGHDAA